MSAESLKDKIKKIFGEQISFNKAFDDYVKVIKNIDERLLEWCLDLKEGKIVPARPPLLPGHLVFIKRIGSSNRCLVIKIINGEFTEVHLADHKYYDEMRKKLGLKKDSYTY